MIFFMYKHFFSLFSTIVLFSITCLLALCAVTIKFWTVGKEKVSESGIFQVVESCINAPSPEYPKLVPDECNSPFLFVIFLPITFFIMLMYEKFSEKEQIYLDRQYVFIDRQKYLVHWIKDMDSWYFLKETVYGYSFAFTVCGGKYDFYLNSKRVVDHPVICSRTPLTIDKMPIC